MINIAGYSQTKFGELWEKSLFELVKESIDNLLISTKTEISEIDAIYFGNMLGGVTENNLHAGSKIAEIYGVNIPVFRVESACASGGMAFNLGHTYLEANPNKKIIVVGAEKMTDVMPEEITEGLSSAASGAEQEAGLTFPGLYALMARTYLDKYNYDKKNLACVAVKNHLHGFLNPYAQFRKKITEEEVLKSPMIADPLGVLDCSPITDGASALLLTNDKKFIKNKKIVNIFSSEIATDSISLMNRKRIDGIDATKIAAEKAYKKAKLKPEDIQIAEVHDCFTIAELFAMEDLGFYKKGTAGKRLLDYETLLDNKGKLIVNTSGGLKSAGHPVGATGIKQIGEIYMQLIGNAENRQVKNLKYGLAHNVGGSGGTAVVSILGI